MKTHGSAKQYLVFFLLLITPGQLCHAAEERKEDEDMMQLNDLVSGNVFGRADEQYDILSEFTSNGGQSELDSLPELTARDSLASKPIFSRSNKAKSLSSSVSKYLDKIPHRRINANELEANLALHEELERTCFGRMIPLLVIEPVLQKSIVWCCLSKANNLQPGYRARGCCKPCIWPRNYLLPSHNDSVNTWIALADSVDGSIRTAFGVLWTPIFNLLMLNDIYNYFAYPGDRGGADLLDVLLGEVDDSVLASFTHNTWFWGILLGLGTTFVIRTSANIGCTIKSSTDAGFVHQLSGKLTGYKSTCWKNTCSALLPFRYGETNTILTHARRLLLWDANLTISERRVLLNGVIKVAETAHSFAKVQAIHILFELSYGVALDDFPRLAAHGMTHNTLVSYLNTKTRAQAALRSLSTKNQGNLICCPYPCSSFWSRIESIYIYFITERSLWKLGYKREQPLVAIFFLLQAKQLYNIILFFKELYDGSANLYNSDQARECERQGYYYDYFPEDGRFSCTVCGDFPEIPFQSTSTREDCWEAFSSSKKTWPTYEINHLMDRIHLESMPITDTNFDNLGLNDALLNRVLKARFSQATDHSSHTVVSVPFSENHNALFDTMTKGRRFTHTSNQMKGLYFSNNQISNLSLLAHYLPTTNISFLGLSGNQITDITALVEVLPTTSISSLDISNNLITDIMPLIKILPDIGLKSLSLSGNPIGALNPFVQALIFYNVEEVDLELAQIADSHILDDMVTQYRNPLLDLENKQINNDDLAMVAQALPIGSWKNVSLRLNQFSDITLLASELPFTGVKFLDLSSNQIRNITALVHALPSSQVTLLDLSWNDISDITAFAIALPDSNLTYLSLHYNQIRDITPITNSLPFSHLTHLGLSWNNISDIFSLAEAIADSSLIHLELAWNNITDVMALASALPCSSLTYLDLNCNRISDITPIAIALPYSSLAYLDLHGNRIRDLAAFSITLPYSSLFSLNLRGNKIRNISPLAIALPSSNLRYLYLRGNKIKDISHLAIALPSSKLTYLGLSRNKIRDFAPLIDALPISPLTYLGLAWNSISNITSIAEALPFSNLSSLDLSGNKIRDLTPLADAIPFSNLTLLYLSSNKIRNLTTFLNALPSSKLTHLYLRKNKISDLTPFTNILRHTHLTHLYLSNNPIHDLTPFAAALSASKLIHFELARSCISDLTAFASALPSSIIIYLDLRSNQISNIAHLASVLPYTKLEHIDLRGNQINSLTPFGIGLPSPKLTYLNLRGNQVSNLTDFAYTLPFSNLTYLDLTDNNISDISPFVYALCLYHVESLQGLVGTKTPFATALAIQYGRRTLSISAVDNDSFDIQLLAEVLPNSLWEDLRLSGNAIMNITLLAKALPQSNVRHLDLTDNDITDIAPLFKILHYTNLKSLYLQGNQINNITTIAETLPYTGLEILNLSDNQISNTFPLTMALNDSILTALYLKGNRISNIIPIAQVLPYASLSILDLRSNQISNITPIFQALPYTNVTHLYLGENEINDITILESTLCGSYLISLDLSNNSISDINPISNAIAHEEGRNDHSWFDWMGDESSYLQENIAELSNNCSLTQLDLSNNDIQTPEAIHFCRALVASNIDEFSLVGNKDINPNVVNPYTCRLSAAPRDSITATFALVSALVAYWLR